MDVENECESGSVESEYAGSEGSYEEVQMMCMCLCLDVFEREQRTFNQIVIHTLLKSERVPEEVLIFKNKVMCRAVVTTEG